MVFGCGTLAHAGVSYKYLPFYPSVNVYKIETTTQEVKLPPPVPQRNDSITVRYLNTERQTPKPKVTHNFKARRF